MLLSKALKATNVSRRLKKYCVALIGDEDGIERMLVLAFGVIKYELRADLRFIFFCKILKSESCSCIFSTRRVGEG